jgi:hypothetical protein
VRTISSDGASTRQRRRAAGVASMGLLRARR